MLTGKRVFRGDSLSEILASVLRSDPDWNLLPFDTPASIRKLLRRCLTKDRKLRLRDIGEARITIDECIADPAAATVPDVPAKFRERVAWGVAALALLLALGLSVPTVLHFRESPAEAPPMRLEINTPPTSDPISLALSPDGRRLVFVASSEGSQRLWLRSLDAVSAQPLAGTEGAGYPFWSPDSRSIGFFAQGKLKRIDVAGGAPQVLASAPVGRGGAWNREGIIAFAPAANTPLYRMSASGGDPIAITNLDAPRQTTHRFPQFLPDGRRLLFSAGTPGRGAIEIYLGSLDSTESRRLMEAETAAAYAPSGHLLYLRQGVLVAHRFDASRGELSGDAVAVADSVGFIAGINLGAFSVSSTGILAYRASGARRWQLVWFDRSGKELGTLGALDENLFSPELSPDGRRVAVERLVQGNSDVWLIETAREVASRFTFAVGRDAFPLWSPDGSRIVFRSNRKGAVDLYQKPSNGAGSEELLLESSVYKFPDGWSPDGRFILYRQQDPKKTGEGLWVLPMSGERKPFPFVTSGFDEGEGQFSPDGRWVAYRSNESGRNEVYVQPFPGPGGKWQVSTGGGISPRWRRDGKELFYIGPDGKLMAAGILAKGETLEAGAPATLFQARIAGGGAGLANKAQYAVAPDGRFLMNLVTDEGATPITVILNWPAFLKK